MFLTNLKKVPTLIHRHGPDFIVGIVIGIILMAPFHAWVHIL